MAAALPRISGDDVRAAPGGGGRTGPYWHAERNRHRPAGRRPCGCPRPYQLAGAHRRADDTADRERGQLRFPALPPGIYVLDIELQGFAPLSRWMTFASAPAPPSNERVQLRLAERHRIRRRSRAPARGSTHAIRIRNPIRPRGPQGDSDATGQHVRLHQSRPGVSPTSPAQRPPSTTVSAFGSGTNENQFLIDGTNFTCPCNGVARSEPGVDFIQEVQVQSVGASAEYGNVQGARHQRHHQAGRRTVSCTTRRTTGRPPA